MYVLKITNDGIYTNKNDHCHAPDYKKIQNAVFKHLLRIKVSSDMFMTGFNVYNHCYTQLQNLSNQIWLRQSSILDLGSYTYYKSFIYRLKNELYPTTRQNDGSFDFDRDKIVTKEGNNFILIDDYENTGSLVLGDHQLLSVLNFSQCCLFADGTFKSSTSDFYQLYNIHILTQGGITIPIIFCFLSNKAENTYFQLFARIKQWFTMQQIEFNPSTIMIDYEIAAYNALRRIFPLSNIRGCLFHFAQCIWQKLSELGFKTLYNNCQHFETLVNYMVAIALVPPDMMHNAWNIILQEARRTNTDITSLLQYFYRTWLVNEHQLFNINTWNHWSNQGPRTNNNVESFHSKLGRMMTSRRPNFYQIITILAEMNDQAKVYYTRILIGHSPNKRKKKYVEADERLERLKFLFIQNPDYTLEFYMLNVGRAMRFINE